MNARVVLVGLGVAVLGAAVYFLVIRDGDDETGDRVATPGAADPERELPPGEARGGTAPDRDPGGAGAVDPDDPDDPDMAPTVVEHVREDGTVVRDHRANPTEYLRPSLPHRDRSPVTGEITAAVMKLVRPVVLGCMKDVPEAAYGEDPLVMTRATISIDEKGTLTVDEIGPALKDIDEAAAAAALECMRSQSGSLTQHVDHAAVASTNLAFPIRPLDYRRGTPPSR